jgi:hypothetical protein
MVATPKGADEVVLASFGHGDSRDVWRFDDGTEIVTVGRHRFWNHELGEPMYLEAWHIGEHAVRSDGKLTALVSHEHIEEPSDHATLFTKRWNAYYAGGLLAGNRSTDKEVMA